MVIFLTFKMYFCRFRSDDDFNMSQEALLKKVPSNVSDASDDNTPSTVIVIIIYYYHNISMIRCVDQ